MEMQTIQKKATAMLLIMVMVLGGITGLLTPGESKAYATPEPAAVTISDENITNVVTSSDKKTVTLTTNNYMALKSGVSVTEAVYVKRTGSDNFVNIITDSPANIGAYLQTPGDQTVFTITFDAALTGKGNLIQIQGEWFESKDSGQYVGNATIQPLDIQAPAYTGSRSYWGNDVSLFFDETIILNNVDTVDDALFLQSKMSISTNGEDFVALSNLMTISMYYPDNTIELYYDSYDMKVILGANTRIKIASDTFKDAEGNFNAEMVVDINPPVIQSAVISEDNKEVTITFNESVSENTNSMEGDLKDNIYLSKNGSSSQWTSLTEEDTVSIVNGKLVIHFDQALAGAINQIKISGAALKDSAGNIEGNDTITPFIQAGLATDTTAPRLINYYLSSDLRDVTFVFDEDVVSNTEDINKEIGRYTNDVGWKYGIDVNVEFSENTVILHFDTPQNANYLVFRINSNSLKDKAGNIQYNLISTDGIYPHDPLIFNNNNISFNGRLLNLKFSSDIGDNTIVAGVSHLKEKIKVSTDQGENFLPLTAEDIVTIQEYKLVVLFHDAKKSGTVHVKVEAGALMNVHVPSHTNSAIDTVIAYNTPDVNGYFFSNAASEFVFEDDGVWSNKVRNVMLSYNSDYYDNDIVRQLTSSEYTIAAGKLTVNQGVFQDGIFYNLYVEADGYSSKQVSGEAFTSSELFYMTTPVISTQGGIMAKVNILRNKDIYINSGYETTQAVVFVLMNGTTPVSIVASESDVYYGTYSAQFNVIDSATNPNYTVRAFIVSNFSNDYTNVGLNMSTQVTQAEFKLKLNEYGYYYS